MHYLAVNTDAQKRVQSYNYFVIYSIYRNKKLHFNKKYPLYVIFFVEMFCQSKKKQ